MKTILLRLSLIIAFLITGQSLKATHSWGTEITYKCLNANGNYLVTLVYYRDCSGVPTCTGSCSAITGCNKTIEVRGVEPAYNGQIFTTVTLTGVSVREISSNPACPGSKTNCTTMGCETAGSLTPGVERYEFQGTVNLGPFSAIPTTCCKVVLSFEECCRSGSNQNVNPQNHYTEAMINRCLMTFPNCNAPIPQQEIQPVLCANQGYIISFAAFDPDLDSLAYKFTPALIGFGVSASYISPYTYSAPMPYLPPLNGTFPNGIKLDAHTGELFVTPTSYPFLGTLSVQIEKWRKVNGTMQLVGTTQRDENFYIKYCDPNNYPKIYTNPPGDPVTQPKIKLTTCKNSLLCFDVIAKDSDFNWPTLSDTTDLKIDSNILHYGATFLPNYTAATRSTNGPREDSYKFCWMPADSIPDETDFNVVISASDRRCPYPGIVQRAFIVRVAGYRPLIAGDSNVFANTTYTYSTPFHTRSAWAWSIEGGVIMGMTNRNTVTVQWNDVDSGKISVNEFGCGSLSTSMNVNITNNTGIAESVDLIGIELYPQPAKQTLLIKGELALLTMAELFMPDGKSVKMFSSAELQKGELNILDIPTGTYFLHFKNRNGVTAVKKVSIIK